MRTASLATLTVEHALLGFIYERPMHGYELYQHLAQTDGLWQVWRLKQSQLYALLTKFEDEGYLTATLQPQESRPPRKIYSLTGAGQTAFLNWLNSPVAHGRQIRVEFLAKLYFAYRQGPVVALNLIELQMAACRRWLAELHKEAESGADVQTFTFIVLQFRLSQFESFLAWLSICRQTLLTSAENG
jgi:DNA-binding PadR family transcriptional regulator